MSSPNDPPSTLGSLLARHKAGDPAAVNEIIEYCLDRFRRIAHARRPSDVDTDDVVNELVVRLLKSLQAKTFDSPAEFLSYAGLSIRSCVLDLLKKCKPELIGNAGSDTGAPNPIDGKPDTTNDPEKLAEWGEVHAIIDQSPDEERQLFDHLFYLDLSIPEASELLGIPETTLRVKWNNAKVNFMRRYGNNPPFSS